MPKALTAHKPLHNKGLYLTQMQTKKLTLNWPNTLALFFLSLFYHYLQMTAGILSNVIRISPLKMYGQNIVTSLPLHSTEDLVEEYKQLGWAQTVQADIEPCYISFSHWARVIMCNCSRYFALRSDSLKVSNGVFTVTLLISWWKILVDDLFFTTKRRLKLIKSKL